MVRLKFCYQMSNRLSLLVSGFTGQARPDRAPERAAFQVQLLRHLFRSKGSHGLAHQCSSQPGNCDWGSAENWSNHVRLPDGPVLRHHWCTVHLSLLVFKFTKPFEHLTDWFSFLNNLNYSIHPKAGFLTFEWFTFRTLFESGFRMAKTRWRT
jgi:hypothetical protein